MKQPASVWPTQLREAADVLEDLAAPCGRSGRRTAASGGCDRRSPSPTVAGCCHEDGAFYAGASYPVNAAMRRDLSRPLLRSALVRLLRSLRVWVVIVARDDPFRPSGDSRSRSLPPRRRMVPAVLRAAGRGMILAASGVRVRVLHAERLARDGSFVIASNHESFYDILGSLRAPADAGALPRQAQPLPAPVPGLVHGGGGLRPGRPRDHARGNGDARRGAVAPPGTAVPWSSFPRRRARARESSSPFKSGAALFAHQVGHAAAAGRRSRELSRVHRRGGFSIPPGPVVVAVGEPIAVAGKSTPRPGRDDRDAARSAIEALRDEARGALT